MANRYFSQFFFSFFKKPVMLAGNAIWNSAVASSLVVQDLTYTADTAGEAGDLISITYTGGGTAGSEVVSVVGNAISVQIQTGVSTATQVKAAVDADVTASALISVAITGVGATAQVVAAAAFLAGGEDNEFQSLSFTGVDSISVNGAGDYTINLADNYSSLISFNGMIESTTSQDRKFQIDSNSIASGSLGLRLLAVATPTHPVDASKVYFQIFLSNSSV
jgi:hypothetical protein